MVHGAVAGLKNATEDECDADHDDGATRDKPKETSEVRRSGRPC
jgi:hypothetical protein